MNKNKSESIPVKNDRPVAAKQGAYFRSRPKQDAAGGVAGILPDGKSVIYFAQVFVVEPQFRTTSFKSFSSVFWSSKTVSEKLLYHVTSSKSSSRAGNNSQLKRAQTTSMIHPCITDLRTHSNAHLYCLTGFYKPSSYHWHHSANISSTGMLGCSRVHCVQRDQ